MDAVQSMVLKLLATRDKSAPASPTDKQGEKDFKESLQQELEKAVTAKDGQPTGSDAPTQPSVSAPRNPVQGEALTEEQQALLVALLAAPTVVPMEEAMAMPQTTQPVAMVTEIAVGTAVPVPSGEVQPQQTLPQTQPQTQPEQQLESQQVQTARAEQPLEAPESAVKPAQSKPMVETAQSGTEQKQDETLLSGETKVEAPLFRELEGRPVKVGESAKAEMLPETVDTQVDKAVRQLLQEGDSKMTLQLTPGNLGKVTVELTRSADGSLQILLSATTEKAVSLLERSSGNLQSLLMGSSNQSQVQIEVQRQQESQQAQQQPFDQNGKNGREQPQQQPQRDEKQQAQDFLQQLRLGLVDLDGVSSFGERSA